MSAVLISFASFPTVLEVNKATRRTNPVSAHLNKLLAPRALPCEALEEDAPHTLRHPHGPLSANCQLMIWRKLAGAACMGSTRMRASAGLCAASPHCPFWRETTMTCSK